MKDFHNQLISHFFSPSLINRMKGQYHLNHLKWLLFFFILDDRPSPCGDYGGVFDFVQKWLRKRLTWWRSLETESSCSMNPSRKSISPSTLTTSPSTLITRLTKMPATTWFTGRLCFVCGYGFERCKLHLITRLWYWLKVGSTHRGH